MVAKVISSGENTNIFGGYCLIHPPAPFKGGDAMVSIDEH